MTELSLTPAAAAAITLLPSPHGAELVFNPKDYGAVGDGVNDDTAAIQAAVTAAENAGGGDVYIPNGDFLLGSGGAILLSPNDGTRGWVRIVFAAGAKLTLSTGAPGAFWFNRTADYDVFRKIAIVSAEIDANNITGFSATAVIGLGAASGTNRISYEDIHIVDPHIYNLPANLPTFLRAGIWLDSYQPGPGYPEATQQTVKRIFVIRPRIYGGDHGINISARPASSSPSGTNTYFDDIHIVDPIIELNASGPPATALSQSGIIVGNSGFGNKCRILNPVVKYSGDVGIEVDGMTDVVIENPDTTDCRHGVFSNTMHPAEDVSRQRFIIQNPRHRVTSAWALGATSYGIKISPANPFGTLIIRNQRFNSDGQTDSTNPVDQGLALKLSGSFQRIDVDGCIAKLTNGVFDKSSLTTVGMVDITNSLSGGIVTLRNVDGDISGNRTGSGGLNVRVFAIRGGNITVKIDGVGFGWSITSGTASAGHAIVIGETTTTTLNGSIRGVAARACGSDTDPRAIRFFAGTTINGPFPIGDCDFSGMGGSGANDIVCSDATSWAKLRLTSIRWVNASLQRASTAALSIPDTGVVEVTGTTGITSITALPKTGGPVTLKFTGVLTVTAGSNLVLAGGASFTTAANATLTMICDGTNWIEVARKS